MGEAVSAHQTFMPDERERVAKKRRLVKKTVVVQYHAKDGRASIWFTKWTTFKRYADLATAQQVLQQKSGDRYFEYRILP